MVFYIGGVAQHVVPMHAVEPKIFFQEIIIGVFILKKIIGYGQVKIPVWNKLWAFYFQEMFKKSKGF